MHKTICWLCCDPLPPIPLGGKASITIGRTDGCDLVLPHKEVSRVHALIKVRASQGMIVFEDEGSSNGSYVNGKRTSSSILRENDVVALGPYELVIRSNEAMLRRELKDGETTNSLELTSVARVKPSAAMTGLLQEVPMSEVLQGIEFNKKTGTLTVSGPGGREGHLICVDGQPWSARFGEEEGDEAVLSMVQMRDGRFTLTGDADTGDREMKITLTGLLLEASRRIDENHTNKDEPLSHSSDDHEAPADDRAEAWADDESAPGEETAASEPVSRRDVEESQAVNSDDDSSSDDEDEGSFDDLFDQLQGE